MTANPWANDTSSPWSNYGPLLAPQPQPRCGHCGQFLPRPLAAFEAHLEVCRVGGTFVNGVLRNAKTSRPSLNGTAGETYEQTQPWSLRSMSALSFDACCQDDRADLLVT